jgi:hypothetical protein
MHHPIAIAFAASLFAASAVQAATLEQTVHFPGAKASELFDLDMSGEGQQSITGLPATYSNAAGEPVAKASVGDTLAAFCFTPEMCGLSARVVSVGENEGAQTVVMSWWNFGWVSAIDESDYSVPQRGAPDSTLVLTFRDTLAGAQVELVQVNVPDYKVRIPNPDGSEEVGPLSSIVNTHWNTLYWDGIRRLTGN